MSNLLRRICDQTREHVAFQKTLVAYSTLEDKARSADAPRGFSRALQARINTGDIGLITEIKKASPSAGVLRPDFSPAKLAQDYAAAGATCLSVLTDAPYFQGSNGDLIEARAACALPVLRKDFMIDVWQVTEARAIGADCILIIMAAVDDVLARDLHHAATAYGMDVLIETHDRAEIERALKLPSGLIGINNRNLKTLAINLATTEELAPLVPQDRTLVCESGIRDAQDIVHMRLCNAHAFLVGESLLKQGDVGDAVKNLTRLAKNG